MDPFFYFSKNLFYRIGASPRRKGGEMKWEGFAYAAGAAVGHSCIDVSRKMAARHYSPMELIALVGIMDALILSALAWDKFGWLFEREDENLLRIIVVSGGVKVMAGYMYQRALQVSPISVTVPYLAFTPVMIIFTSYFLMNERPSLRGLIGVLIVTVGGYLLVIHSKEPADSNRASLRICSTQILEPLVALKREEGSLLMLSVAGLFSISNSLDKMGAHMARSSVLFAAVQRLIMAIPVVFYLILTSPRSFKHLLHFPAFAVISVFEVTAFICYLKSLETLLVSYAIAAKRSNVLLSVLVGRVVFKENIWRKLPFVMLMVGGMILVILA